jgi:hypothetical protein
MCVEVCTDTPQIVYIYLALRGIRAMHVNSSVCMTRCTCMCVVFDRAAQSVERPLQQTEYKHHNALESTIHSKISRFLVHVHSITVALRYVALRWVISHFRSLGVAWYACCELLPTLH